MFQTSSSDRSLSYLRGDLRLLENRTTLTQDDVFFVDVLRDCYTLRRSADDNRRTEIVPLIQEFELIIELLRRKRIRESRQMYLFLDEIIEDIAALSR